MRTPEEQIRYAASITPSPRQLAWQQLEFYAFTHFWMPTNGSPQSKVPA